ncbi:MAG: hypothetical protein AAF208_01910 [Cyanobacteria bacterium P01_A01_bin.45]
MNAIQHNSIPVQPLPKNPTAPRPKRHLRQRAYQTMALETTVKIGVNCVLAAAAVSALIQLLPHHWSQQDKLRAIKINLKQTEKRVDNLQAEFNRNFDPSNAKLLMQQQGYRFDPKQRNVVFNDSSDRDD